MTRDAEKKGAHYHYFAEAMRRVETALHGQLARSDLIPDGWAAIARRPPRPAKAQITLRLDGDVLAFFRGMGAGYQTRMNDVLAAYMHARVAGVVRGAEAAGGSVLAGLRARDAEAAMIEDMRRQLDAAAAADHARLAAMPAAEKRKLRVAELKAAAAGRKRGVGRVLP